MPNVSSPLVRRDGRIQQIRPRPEQNNYVPTKVEKLNVDTGDHETRIAVLEAALALLNVTGTATPTPTAASGTFTSASATTRWQKNGKWVLLEGRLLVTTLGTAAGAFLVPLPFTAAAHASGGGGIRSGDGVGLSVYINSGGTTVNLLTVGAASPGETCQFAILYEAA